MLQCSVFVWVHVLKILSLMLEDSLILYYGFVPVSVTYEGKEKGNECEMISFPVLGL